MVEVKEGQFTVSYRFRHEGDNMVWSLTGVYGPVNNAEKTILWEVLGAIRSLWLDLWCVGGDFNVVRFPLERIGGGSTNVI